ncbi:MAG: hypothetical protein B7Z73_03005 [Planctomycetia bacterium 21-64-5]|nr:MAG: hypothetical protein B7Z73_03005 [Planctomycetia bacterium 21-64-5]
MVILDFGFSIFDSRPSPLIFLFVIFPSFLSLYRAAGLAWIRGGRCPASFPMFYRAAGLGPDLFDFSPQLDERRRAGSPPEQ